MCKRICIKKLDVGLDSSSLMPLVHTSKVLLCCRAKHISWHSMPLQSNEITTNQTQGSNLNSLNICRLYSKKQASKRHSHQLQQQHPRGATAIMNHGMLRAERRSPAAGPEGLLASTSPRAVCTDRSLAYCACRVGRSLPSTW